MITCAHCNESSLKTGMRCLKCPGEPDLCSGCAIDQMQSRGPHFEDAGCQVCGQPLFDHYGDQSCYRIAKGVT